MLYICHWYSIDVGVGSSYTFFFLQDFWNSHHKDGFGHFRVSAPRTLRTKDLSFRTFNKTIYFLRNARGRPSRVIRQKHSEEGISLSQINEKKLKWSALNSPSSMVSLSAFQGKYIHKTKIWSILGEISRRVSRYCRCWHRQILQKIIFSPFSVKKTKLANNIQNLRRRRSSTIE